MSLSSSPRAWLERLATSGERRLLLLTGSHAWCQDRLTELLPSNTLWLGSGPAAFAPQAMDKPAHWLGQEYSHVVLNGFDGLHPDALGAVAGVVRAGGLLCLMMPPLADWPSFADPDLRRFVSTPTETVRCQGFFLARLARLLQAGSGLWRWDQASGWHTDEPWPLHLAPWSCHATLQPTDDQQAALMALRHCAAGHPHRPLLIAADRGRGKSTVLGLAAAQLLQRPGYRVLLTAPSRKATEQVFVQLRRLLPEALEQGERIELGSSQLTFYSPDALLEQQPEADLLLIDEAAAIPTPLLQDLLRHYSRVVFATTLHGYEGSGQGFALRMQPYLDRYHPGWQRCHLSQPVRWHTDDPLEPLLNRLLLLGHSEPPPVPSDDPIVWQHLSQTQLANDEALLRQLFGLLIQAHYQTTPSDLRTLLDSPDLTIHGLRQGAQWLGVALLCAEGPIEPELAQTIRRGERRPRGQLLPQTLLAHAGIQEAADFRYARIMRIAIHPTCQRQGLGQQLLTALTDDCRQQGYDLLGAAFAATPELLHFWRRAGWQPVRLGLSRDAASGSHSAVLLQPLSAAASQVLPDWRQRFQQQLPQWLGGPLRDLPPQLVLALLDQANDRRPLQPWEWQDVIDCAHGHRSLDHALPSLQRWLDCRREDWQRLPQQEQLLLVGRFWQYQSWSALGRLSQLPGQKALQQAIRSSLRKAGVPERLTEDFLSQSVPVRPADTV
ncbi:tRNA(Met) cytidine acetyltransferase TmcA [Pseudaeromonas paramecii]|uniref:tRNA(Met) cytidine acetyltransferase TmcA n=1 Tax=Pseudaeromonas paramecii TaxID=2138166 RepID=A0ABP8PW71_9GAMM